MTRFLFAFAVGVLLAAPAAAGPKVTVVVSPDAPKLEKFAASELAALLKQLFEAEVTVSDAAPAAKPDPLILLGSPATNPAVAKAVGDQWPKLSGQGHVLKSAGGAKALVVGGGSPVATLWAAYELGHHFGVRSFLHGDVMPEKVPPLKLDGIDVVLEPSVAVRAWRLLGDAPAGLGGWGLDDHKQLLRQLAKLKFNAVEIAEPKQPLGGRKFPVAGDTPGRKAFKGAKAFANPDAGDDLARGVRAAGEALGFAVGPLGKPTPLALAGFLPRTPALTPPPGVGFVIDAAVLGDLGPSIEGLSRRAFGEKPTPAEAGEQFFAPILGAESTKRVTLGFEFIDAAAGLVAKNDPAFAADSPDVLLRHLKSADPPPAWWKEAREKYTEGMNEMYRGIRATFNAPARDPLLYYAKRCEFAVNYIAAMEATRLAGVAKAKGDKDAVVEQLEKATEAMYNALNAYGDVARDPSDRGVIAVLAEHAYRPLKAELKAAEKAARGK